MKRFPSAPSRVLSFLSLSTFIVGGGWLAQHNALAQGVSVSGAVLGTVATADTSPAAGTATTTPIKHLVVIFQENVSFDHYFATYPQAANPPGEPAFTPAPGTPSVNGLGGALLTHNPNLAQPFRLDRTQALTCDQDHDYTAEQKASDGGLMDKFVQNTTGSASNARQYCPKSIVMGYYDGNTVTGLWNYAQHYAMSDNSFGTVYGPSTPGALNLVGADTSPVICGPSSAIYGSSPCSPTTPPAGSGSTSASVYSDADQYYDDFSSGGYGSAKTIAMGGRTIGDLLDTAGVTWGWFNGGFDAPATIHDLTAVDRVAGVNPTTDTTTNISDYSAHHEPFQYFASTSNPHHVKPSSVAMIGRNDVANHQYDLTDFWAAADSGNLPAVSFLKAARYQDGHAGYSDPLDEQEFLVNTINHLESLPSWPSTAVIISYDDSDGWYDHVFGPVVNHSNTSLDVNCGSSNDGAPARCGYGPRLPYLVISPWSKVNYVDHTVTDQSSTIRFVEDNWLGGQRISSESFDNLAGSIMGMFDFSQRPQDWHRLFLNPQSGEPTAAARGIATGQGFEVLFTSASPGQGAVYFGSGPGCSGLVQVGTQDMGAGTTNHDVLVTGNDLPGTVGNIGITPGATYSFETVTSTASGTEIDNNGGACYTVTVPR